MIFYFLYLYLNLFMILLGFHNFWKADLNNDLSTRNINVNVNIIIYIMTKQCFMTKCKVTAFLCDFWIHVQSCFWGTSKLLELVPNPFDDINKICSKQCFWFHRRWVLVHVYVSVYVLNVTVNILLVAFLLLNQFQPFLWASSKLLYVTLVILVIAQIAEFLTIFFLFIFWPLLHIDIYIELYVSLLFFFFFFYKKIRVVFLYTVLWIAKNVSADFLVHSMMWLIGVFRRIGSISVN